MLALAGWLTGQWIYRPLELERLHPGYFLPSVAGGYVASIGAVTPSQPLLAEVLFGLGSASWVVLGPLNLARLMFRPPLPGALLPTIAIEIAPSALATLAWLSPNGCRLDAVTSGLASCGLLMVLAQLRLLQPTGGCRSTSACGPSRSPQALLPPRRCTGWSSHSQQTKQPGSSRFSAR